EAAPHGRPGGGAGRDGGGRGGEGGRARSLNRRRPAVAHEAFEAGLRGPCSRATHAGVAGVVEEHAAALGVLVDVEEEFVAAAGERRPAPLAALEEALQVHRGVGDLVPAEVDPSLRGEVGLARLEQEPVALDGVAALGSAAHRDGRAHLAGGGVAVEGEREVLERLARGAAGLERQERAARGAAVLEAHLAAGGEALPDLRPERALGVHGPGAEEARGAGERGRVRHRRHPFLDAVGARRVGAEVGVRGGVVAAGGEGEEDEEQNGETRHGERGGWRAESTNRGAPEGCPGTLAPVIASVLPGPRTPMEDLRYPIGRYALPSEIARGDRAAWITDLALAPAALRTAVEGLSEQRLDTPYRPGGWTVRQVVHHLPDSHLNAYTRFKLALTEDAPTIKPYDEAAWAELPDSEGPIDPSLDL